MCVCQQKVTREDSIDAKSQKKKRLENERQSIDQSINPSTKNSNVEGWSCLWWSVQQPQREQEQYSHNNDRDEKSGTVAEGILRLFAARSGTAGIKPPVATRRRTAICTE